MEISKTFFVASRPKERYIRSSYDYFKQNENKIISVIEDKKSSHFLTGLSTMSQKMLTVLVWKGREPIYDGTENFEKILLRVFS